MAVQRSGRYFRVAARDGFQDGVVDENVLVFRLHHVVPLSPQTGHVAVDVDTVFVAQPLQHRVDDDKGARSADAGAAVDDDGLVIGGNSVAEAAHETYERRRRVGYAEIGPRGEVEVADNATRFALLLKMSR